MQRKLFHSAAIYQIIIASTVECLHLCRPPKMFHLRLFAFQNRRSSLIVPNFLFLFEANLKTGRIGKQLVCSYLHIRMICA